MYVTMGNMVRTTIYLPDEMKRDLEARAHAQGRTESEIIRESLSRTLRGHGRTAKDLRFGMFDSGRDDTSSRVDEILTESGFGAS
jgi:predicted transcriptional regulator